jgi:4,5-dihydroxyphthalate decarboxylase
MRANRPDVNRSYALTVSQPWAPVEAARMQEFFGDDFWSYGVDTNRASLDAVIRRSFAQGITARQLTIEDIFPTPALDWKKY